jgi:MFS transporter, UMF1 family
MPWLGGNRKKLLLAFGFIGATSSMLFILVFPGIYLVGVFLTIASVASLGSSFVLLNSFLPLLVANHPSIRGKFALDSVILRHNHDEEPLDDEDPLHDDLPADGLLNGRSGPYIPLRPNNVSPALKLSNHISSKGVGIGYAAAVFVQFISISIILIYSKVQPAGLNSTMPMRTVLFVVGVWWAAFIIPTAFWLRRRPGPPLPLKMSSMAHGRFLIGLRYVAFAWASLWRTVKVALQLRQVLVFLLGWFLLSDGVATITGTAILFARTELKLSTAAVALLSITATASGIFGAFCWPLIGRRYRLNSISIVLCCVFMFEFIPLYCLLGFVPFIKSLGFIGLQQWWEIYPLGFLLGFIMGGISSYCRSVFGSLIPPGMEAAFYALYAVTDKGSSIIGPAIVGRIVDGTGSIRMAFWFLAFLMVSPAPFFWFVDVEKGQAEGLMMAKRSKQLEEMMNEVDGHQ